jgi:hypothetical protein
MYIFESDFPLYQNLINRGPSRQEMTVAALTMEPAKSSIGDSLREDFETAQDGNNRAMLNFIDHLLEYVITVPEQALEETLQFTGFTREENETTLRSCVRVLQELAAAETSGAARSLKQLAERGVDIPEELVTISVPTVPQAAQTASAPRRGRHSL